MLRDGINKLKDEDRLESVSSREKGGADRRGVSLMYRFESEYIQQMGSEQWDGSSLASQDAIECDLNES